MAETISGAVAAGARSGPRNTANCAIVLEDQPSGVDARMEFQSFEPEITESYTVGGYQEYGAERMSQPGFAAYRGGNWDVMSLTLNFQADGHLNRQIVSGQVKAAEVEGVLVDMERRVRWFEALGFPLRRTADAFADRQIARSTAAGFTPTAQAQTALRNQVRNDPPIFLVVFGSFLIVRGYATSVSLAWKPPFHPVTMRPYACAVTIALQRLEADYPTWQSIRNQGGGSPQTPVKVDGNVQLNADAERQLTAIRGNAARAAAVRQQVATNAQLVADANAAVAASR